MPRASVMALLALGPTRSVGRGAGRPPQGQAELRGTSSVSIHVRATSQGSRLLALATQRSIATHLGSTSAPPRSRVGACHPEAIWARARWAETKRLDLGHARSLEPAIRPQKLLVERRKE
jgi:hypothetical protein